MIYGHGEEPEAFVKTRRRARKAWTCCECRSSIDPGEHYFESSGVWAENGPQRFRHCASCERWANGALHVLKLEGYVIGGLAEALSELTARRVDGEIVHFVDRARV